MDMHLTDDDQILHYYGELSDAEETRAGAHLGSCRECQARYQGLQRVLATVDEYAAAGPELPPHFERVVWARLEPDLGRGRRGWLSWLASAPPRPAWIAAICLLIVAAFAAGRLLPRAGDGLPAATSAADVRERILLVDLGEHLDRSQMVLIELVSAEGADSASLSAERSRAEHLVSANRLYRQSAATTGDSAIVALLDELERVLVDVVARPEALSAEEVESMRRRIESQDLLFKVRVLSSQVRDRQTPVVQERAGRSS